MSLRLNDGRPIAFDLPQFDEPTFLRSQQIEVRKEEKSNYYIYDIKEQLYYYFTKESGDQLRKLSRITNSNGFSIKFDYDIQGNLSKIIDSAHRELKVLNDNKGRIVKILAPDPKESDQTFPIAKYEYDEQGNMIKQTNAVGDSMLFEYQNRLMVKETWRDGMNWFFRYEHGEIGARCVHTWGDGDIYNHKLTYLDAGTTKVEDSLGNFTTYHHKGGLVYHKIDPNGSNHHWLHNKNNELLSETDPLGNTRLYAYNEMGQMTQATDAEGGTTLLEYENDRHPNLVSEIKDKLGAKWKFSYDDEGNVIQRINPKGASTKIKYEDGLPVSIKDPRGNETLLTFDRGYNLSSIVEPTGATTSYGYDKLGRNIKTINPYGAEQHIFYDLNARPIKVEDFDGNSIRLSYDGIDNLTHYKDQHRDVHYSYKGLWKLTERSDGGHTTRFRYNTEEQLTRILNEQNIPYHFALDKVGNVIKEKGFDQKIREYTRDEAGRVLVTKLPSGKEIKYNYDKEGRVVETLYADGESDSFAYGPSGLLTKATNSQATVELIRDNFGQITQEVVNGKEVNSTYDNIGRRTNLQSSLGANIDFEVDTLGNLVNMSAQGAGDKGNEWQAKFSYDKLGLEVDRALTGNISHSWKRDKLGRPIMQTIGHAGQKVKRFKKYKWGVNDRLHQVMDSIHGTTKFSYDNRGYLNHSKYQDGQEEWRTPDAVGNLYETKDKNDRKYTHGGLLEKKGSWYYKYDEDGYLVEKYKKGSNIFKSKDRWLYKWGDNGMLNEVIRPDGYEVTFGYDALGRRLWKRFKNTKTNWLWDGNVPLHEWKEHARTGDILSNSYVNEDGIITWVFEENSFIPAAKLKGSKKYSILADHLGTPSYMYNEEGESVWESSLSGLGRVRKEKGKRNDCPFRYQGHYEDVETGLYYNRFRYFDPEDGRYISRDPIGLASGEFGLFNYVGDPCGWVDVLGLEKTYKAGDKYDDWNGSVDYSGLSNPRKVGKGKNFTSNQKKKIYAENMKQNNGHLVSDLDGTILVPSKKSKKGVTPSPHEVQLDHKKAKSKGGSNKNSNAQVLSRKQNRDKWDS